MSQLSTKKRSAWADHIQSQNESDMSQQAYCTQHRLKTRQPSYWKHQLTSAVEAPSTSQPKSSRRGFTPVKVVAARSMSHLRITLPSGIQLHGIDEQNLPLVQQLISSSSAAHQQLVMMRLMRSPESPPQVFLYRNPVDFRKRYCGLGGNVDLEIAHNIFDGGLNVSVFINRQPNKIKCLFWEV